MLKPESLLVYPYVKLRVSFECGYRVTRLAENFGADIALDDLLYRLQLGRCPRWGKDATFCRLRCGLKFTEDIGSDNSPDVPPPPARPGLLK